jgi:Competence protein
MKRVWIYALLGGVVLFRVSHWRSSRERAVVLCHALEGPLASSPYFSGVPKPLPQGGWTLEEAVFTLGERTEPFWGKVIVEERWGRPFSGQRVLIRGPFRCLLSPQNPAVTDEAKTRPEPPRVGAFGRGFSVVARSDFNSTFFYQRFLAWLDHLSNGFPGVRAWLRSVWVGDATGLPPQWQRFYKESGLQPLIALSGQHVIAFVLVLQTLLRLLGSVFFRWMPRGWYCQGQRLLPLLCSSVLFLTSGGAEPIRRTAAMALAFFVLRLRRKESSALQLAGSSLACLVIWDPGLLTSVSFLLSASGTLMICRLLSGHAESPWFDYCWSATVMPLLVLPLTAFLFAKISLTAPLHSLMLSWLWDLLLIPLGFLLLLCLGGLPEVPRQIVLQGAEHFWAGIDRLHEVVPRLLPTWQVSSVRPTWKELVLLEAFLVFLALFFRDRWERFRKSYSHAGRFPARMGNNITDSG